MFFTSSKLFNWSIFFALLYSFSSLSKAALLISDSAQTSWKTCWLHSSGASLAQSLVVVDPFLEEVLVDFCQMIQKRKGEIGER